MSTDEAYAFCQSQFTEQTPTKPLSSVTTPTHLSDPFPFSCGCQIPSRVEEHSGRRLRTLELRVDALKAFPEAVAGHHLMFRVDKNICKESEEREVAFYERLLGLTPEVGQQWLPYIAAFVGLGALTAVQLREIGHTLSLSDAVAERLRLVLSSSKGSSFHFLILRDVTYGFQQPCVLDVKMGVRGYGLNAAPEKKMSKHSKTIATTSGKLCLRISGMKFWSKTRNEWCVHNKFRGRELTAGTILRFMREFFLDDQSTVDVALVEAMLHKVKGLEKVFTQQEEFQFYTSSLLLTYDAVNPAHTACVTMVDFAHTYTTEEVKHGEPEAVAESRRDEAFLLGLTNLRCVLEGIAEGRERVDFAHLNMMPKVSSLKNLSEAAEEMVS